jgi:hypothetical protein
MAASKRHPASPEPYAQNPVAMANTIHDPNHTNHHRRMLSPNTAGSSQRKWNGRVTGWPAPAFRYRRASGPIGRLGNNLNLGVRWQHPDPVDALKQSFVEPSHFEVRNFDGRVHIDWNSQCAGTTAK